MRATMLMGAALLPVTIALTACSGSQPKAAVHDKAAHHLYLVDVSDSPATNNDPAVAHAVDTRIGADIQRDAKDGDIFGVYEAGSSDAARMIGQPPIVSGYALRLPAARARLIAQLQGIAERYQAQGGDHATHLVQSLEAIHPDCTSGRDTVTLITDGLQEDGETSAARALTAGQPIHLPNPPGGFLAGCRIRFLGFGLTTDEDGKEGLLPARQLAALRQGWLDYLAAAGATTDRVEFVSIL